MNPVILYLAGPITGNPNHEREFNEAEGTLTSSGYTVLNPTTTTQPPGAVWVWSDWMRAGVRQLMEADGVALLPGWELSKGANVERGLAFALGFPIKTVKEWAGGGGLQPGLGFTP